MGRLALVGGHGFGALAPWAQAQKTALAGERGEVTALDAGTHLVLARHGLDSYTPAHLVDHGRNLTALRDAGCDRVLAVCSVGSLRAELEVGSLLCPSDFISLRGGDQVHDDERGHVVPAFDPVWRRLVLESSALAEAAVRDGGVYWQSPGPRFETPAEVRLIAAYADVVGMTMASECVAACELGLAYAAVCVVDNLANGVAASPLSRERYEAASAANRERVAALLSDLVPSLAAAGTHG